MSNSKKSESRTSPRRKRSRSRAVQPAAAATNPIGSPLTASDRDTEHMAWEVESTAATGSHHEDARVQLVNELFRIFDAEGAADGPSNGLAHMLDISPRDGLEGMLAVQMVSVHKIAMRLLALGARDNQPLVAANFFLNHASRLTRLFTIQMEALDRHRGKAPSEQKVTVEYVNVFQGGQAIVGNVTPAPMAVPGGGGEQLAL